MSFPNPPKLLGSLTLGRPRRRSSLFPPVKEVLLKATRARGCRYIPEGPRWSMTCSSPPPAPNLAPAPSRRIHRRPPPRHDAKLAPILDLCVLFAPIAGPTHRGSNLGRPAVLPRRLPFAAIHRAGPHRSVFGPMRAVRKHRAPKFEGPPKYQVYTEYNYIEALIKLIVGQFVAKCGPNCF